MGIAVFNDNCFSQLFFDLPKRLCGQIFVHIPKKPPFLTRGYAQAYHELLQGQGYTNESLAHS